MPEAAKIKHSAIVAEHRELACTSKQSKGWSRDLSCERFGDRFNPAMLNVTSCFFFSAMPVGLSGSLRQLNELLSPAVRVLVGEAAPQWDDLSFP